MEIYNYKSRAFLALIKDNSFLTRAALLSVRRCSFYVTVCVMDWELKMYIG